MCSDGRSRLSDGPIAPMMRRATPRGAPLLVGPSEKQSLLIRKGRTTAMKLSASTLLGVTIALLFGVLLGAFGHATWAASVVEIIDSNDRADAEDEVQEASMERVSRDDALSPKTQVRPTAIVDRQRKTLSPGMDSDLGVVVYGTVRDDEDKPIHSAWIGIQSKTPGEPGINLLAKNGGYTTHGIKPGSWIATIRGEGLKRTQETIDIPSEPVFRWDFVVPRAYIVIVRVKTPEGIPIMKALDAARIHSVALNAVATLGKIQSVPMTQLRYHRLFGIGKWADLRYTMRREGLDDDPEILGLLELSSPPPAYVSLMLKHNILAQKQILPGQKEVSFEISMDAVLAKTATVRLRVVDRVTRQPIADARVGISDRQRIGGGHPTAEDGTIVLTHQPTGILDMRISAKGRESYHRMLRLEAGDVDLGTIELGPPIKIRGIVLSPAGKPQAASVTWTNLAHQTFPQPLFENRSMNVDVKGLFTLGGLGLGRYLIQARTRDHSLATVIVDTDKLSDRPVRLVLKPTLPVAVDNMKMPSLRNRTMLIRDSQRRIVYGQRLTRPYRGTIHLPAGSYSFEVFEGRKQLQTGSIGVKSGSVPTILIQG